MKRFTAAIFTVTLPVLVAAQACAQSYPDKPVRIITGEVGGNIDIAARLIGQGVAGAWGQPVVVENRPSALTPELVARANPDGYTVLFGSPSLWVAPLLQKTSYDAIKDFSPITLAIKAPQLLVVYPLLPVNSAKELIALAKAKPGVLNYAATATGSSNHLSAELFKVMAGVNIVQVNYKGTGFGVNALIAGEVQVMFSTGGSVAPHVKAGRLRALAVTSAQPSALAPGLPTMTSSGVPGYESENINGVFVPAKTPDAIVKRLNQEIVRVLNRTDVKDKFFGSGVETVGNTPEQLGAIVRADIARWSKVIKDADIHANQ